MKSAPESRAERVPFQAETRELLQLVIHSLYTHEEIFLRELVSNASDALDKVRVEALRDGDLAIDVDGLEIRLETDPAARTLSIADNGIGMSRVEVVENLGTIARSGTRAFLENLKRERDKGLAAPELIGQFGVGFYSAFMVADEVIVETRRVGEAEGTRWSSDGQGSFQVEECERARHGTTVTLRLKPVADLGEDAKDFTDEHALRAVIKRYSDFIEYPIRLAVGEGDERKDAVLNSRKPIWTRPRSEVGDEEYAEFYKHLAHDWNEPFETIHFRAEGAHEYTALLFVPKRRPLDLFDPQGARSHLQLYVKRIFIQADCEELAPPWLRFVRGVVDASDLPLNVSRETLQHNRQIAQIQKRVVRKVLDALKARLEKDRAEYAEFWNAFGSVLKEGIYHSDEHREDVARLALFHSTHGDERTTLDEVVQRMPVKQEALYVLCAPDLATAKRSPHLEAFRARGFEVVLLVDPVDEFVLQRLDEFAGKPLRQIDKGALDLEAEGDKEARAEREKALEPVLEAVRKELSEWVDEVRFSARLEESPACLVGGEGAFSPQLERFLRESGQPVPERKRSLELNAEHPLVKRLASLTADDADHARFADTCLVVLGMAHLAEGTPPPAPERFNRIVGELVAGG